MKNYLKFLVFIVLLFSNLPIYSQSSKKVEMLQSGTINTRTGDITWNEAISVDLTITIQSNHIYVNDQAKTHITTYGKSEKYEGVTDDGSLYTRNTWSAYDEKGRNCKFIMIFFKENGSSLYAVLYNNYAFRYYIETKLSNFQL